MARIRNFRDIPPGGWRYVQPETAYFMSADDFDGLVSTVKAHRQYKGLSVEDVPGDIERQICTGLSLAWCKPEAGEDYQPVEDLTAKLTTGMVLSINSALVGIMGQVAAGNSPFCSVEESAKRSAICRGCPFNKPASSCSCSAGYRVIESLIPAARKQPGISVCMACGCSLQAKVNLPLSVVEKSLNPTTVLPPWCWQNQARTLET